MCINDATHNTPKTPYLELVTSTQHLLDIGNAVVADLADVQQTVDTANVNKRAVWLDGVDDTHHHVTHLWKRVLILGGCTRLVEHTPKMLSISPT